MGSSIGPGLEGSWAGGPGKAGGETGLHVTERLDVLTWENCAMAIPKCPQSHPRQSPGFTPGMGHFPLPPQVRLFLHPQRASLRGVNANHVLVLQKAFPVPSLEASPTEAATEGTYFFFFL